MDTEDIKGYVEYQLIRSQRLLESERTASYYEEQLALRQLWLQAEQATWLKRIAFALEALAAGHQS